MENGSVCDISSLLLSLIPKGEVRRKGSKTPGLAVASIKALMVGLPYASIHRDRWINLEVKIKN